MVTKEFYQAKSACGNEIMEVEYWNDEKAFCFSQFRYAPPWHSWKERLRFLFTGQIDYNCIILDETKAKEIADYINKYLIK
jgi:hypothetical protein